MKNFRNFFFTQRFYYLIWGSVVLFLLSLPIPWLLLPAKLGVLSIWVCVFAEVAILWKQKNGIAGERSMPERFSNGDENPVKIVLENQYPFTANIEVREEYPEQFQIRDQVIPLSIPRGETRTINYQLRPVKRGEYHFGAVNVFVTGILGLISRRYKFSEGDTVPVYPSFLQMRQYELMAISNRLTEIGVKKLRKLGMSSEFEQIRPYVQGDDPRKVNWSATARRNELMINNFQDERSQQVYCLIDKGRVMQMPFNEMSLLDYAINASLVISNTALLKGDKAGIITFSNQIGNILPADRKLTHIRKIQEVLYNQKTLYKESDFELLYSTLKHKINQRSLVLLFTNFETTESLKRQLFYLRKIARHHLLVVVFFENSEISRVISSTPKNVEDIYVKTIAEKFMTGKRLIVKELGKYGIQTVLAQPENITIGVINKYLELKARGSI